MTGEFKDDPHFVKWVAQAAEMDTSIGISNNYQFIGFHKCSENDFAKFYPPSKSVKDSYELLRAKEKIHCMNDTDLKNKKVNKKLWGEYWES